MHQLTRAKALLGGQQSLRLQQLQDRSDDFIHRTHLLQQPPALRPSIRERQALYHQQQPPPISQTVEAILDARQQQPSSSSVHSSTAARLRNKIDAARGSIRTERSERPEPLVPPLVAPVRDPSNATSAHMTPLPGTATTTQRRIVAVRRRQPQHLEATATQDGPQRSSSARLGKAELAWVEKQLQLTQRAAMLERECESWWRQFYGASSGALAPVALAIHKSYDELPSARAQDARLMMQQLAALRQKQRGVADKLARMRSGETFFADLQELLEDLETAIAAFRRAQRERYDAYATEERVLEKELSAFAARVDEWDTDTSASAAGAVRARGSSSARRQRAKDVCPAAAQGDSSEKPEHESAAASSNNNSDDAASEAEMLARVRCVNERILQSGGVQGGWDDREHRVFASLLRKHGLSDDVLLAHQTVQVTSPPVLSSSSASSNQHQHERTNSSSGDYEARVAQCLQQIIAKVVTKSANAVRCHLIWYIDHLQLLQQKRDAIHAWRAKKERMRHELISQGLVQAADAPHSSERASPDKRVASSPGATDDRDEQQRHAARAKAKTAKLLSQWRETKAEREKLERARERALAKEQEARDAKRKQELLDAKQHVLLYKLQKEQEAALLEQQQRRPRSSRSQPPSASPDSAPSASPVSRHELLERSRQAIERAKAKRAKLQAREAKHQKQRELPARPPRAAGDDSTTASPGKGGSVLLLQPTKASQARDRTKRELRKDSALRQRQNAHDAVIPGAAAIPDAKVKSFGHVPIQPRAVPAWRRNL